MSEAIIPKIQHLKNNTAATKTITKAFTVVFLKKGR